MSLADGLISFWELEETSGNRLDSKASNDMIPRGAVTFDTGIVGNCVNQQELGLETADSTPFRFGNTDFTIATWVNASTWTGGASLQRLIFTKWNASSMEWNLDWLSSSDRFRFAVRNATNAASIQVLADNFGNVSTRTSEWICIFAWHDSVNDRIGIAVNDGISNITAVSGGLNTVTQTSKTALGTRDGGAVSANGNFNGFQDQSGIWNRVLTSVEREAFYNSGVGLTYAQLGESESGSEEDSGVSGSANAASGDVQIGHFQDTPYFNDISPETSIRIYDEAIKEWLLSMRFRNQTPNVVTSWMSRHFSQKKDIQGDKVQRSAMPYPMVSLGYGGAIVPDLDRRNVNDVYVLSRGAPTQANRAYWPVPGKEGSSKDDREAVLVFPFPLPYSIPYTIDLWTKTRQDWRFLSTAIMARFPYTDTTYLNVPIPGYGQKLIRLTLDSVDDTSDLETGEVDRVLRATISLTLHGWIWRVPKVKRTILQSHTVFLDATGDADNLLDGSDFASWYCDASHYNFSSDGSRLLSVDESPDFSPPDRTLLWVSYQQDGTTEIGTQAG